MTKEDKQLLLKDLCGRLPYGVMVENVLNHEIFDLSKYLHCLPAALENFKPYLRPMSSMTEEEKKVFNDFLEFESEYVDVDLDNKTDMYDWLNKNKFDYRGLIKKGMALEAPEDMYKEN